MIPRRSGKRLRRRPWQEVRERRRQGIYLFPSLLTTGNVFCGFFSMVLASDHRFTEAAVAIFVAMIMDLLNPQQVEAVDKIEGDRIFLKNPDKVPPSENAADQEAKNKDHVADMAVDQIKQSLSQPAATPPPEETPVTPPPAKPKPELPKQS